MAVTAALASASACAPKAVVLPTGAGSPFTEAAAAYRLAVEDCRGARTLTATLALSGRAGEQRIRGEVDAGFAAPDSIRLEGKAPFGRPAFILASAGAEATTLYLPRDNRVVRRAETADIVEALVGLPLGAAELRRIVSGCGFEVSEPNGGREYPGGWVAVDTGAATTYLREIDRQWRVAAAARPGLVVYYGSFVSGHPSSVRLIATGAVAATVTARISDRQINVALEPAAFEVEVPPGADALSLDELRQAGPLGGA